MTFATKREKLAMVILGPMPPLSSHVSVRAAQEVLARIPAYALEACGFRLQMQSSGENQRPPSQLNPDLAHLVDVIIFRIYMYMQYM